MAIDKNQKHPCRNRIQRRGIAPAEISALYRALVRAEVIGTDLTFVNADIFERDHLQHITDREQRSQAARAWADAQRTAKLLAGESFVSETVLSHESKLALIEEAVAHGYVLALYVVAPDSLLEFLKAL